MIVFATKERGWTDKFFFKPKSSFQISKDEIVFSKSKDDFKKNSKGKSSLQETISLKKFNIFF